MAEIIVKELSHDAEAWVFQAEVLEGVSRTVHEVSLSQANYKKLTRERVSPAELVYASFQFLLEREDKESILSQFELTVIAKYFPEYPKKISGYFAKKK